jgi:hypothetical protein
MFYQTTLRNVALFTSISFAAFGYSRVFVGKSKIHRYGLLSVGLVFNIIAFIINLYLLMDMTGFIKKKKKEIDDKLLSKWLIIPKIILVLQILLFIFGILTVFV